MGRNSTQGLIRRICENVETELRSIQDIADAADADRNSVVRYLDVLAETGVIREVRDGNERLFFRPVMSDRQLGLKLRGLLVHLWEGETVQAYEKVGELLNEIEQQNRAVSEILNDSRKDGGDE